MYIATEEFLYENIIKRTRKEIDKVINQIEEYYTLVEIPKANGTRTICAIEYQSTLYNIQKNIQKNFLSKIPLPICVKGFCKGNSYADFLEMHKNQKYYMRLDIKDFFGSIKGEQIYQELLEYVKDENALFVLVFLCTYNGELPQGAITSPTISNIVFRRIDQRITKYCQKLDIIYTRYADDLIFSSNQINFKEQVWFYKKIAYILRESGFQINRKKIHNQEQKLTLNGFVVKQEVSLSRRKLNNLNKIIYYFKDKTKVGKYKIATDIKQRNWLEEINGLGLKSKNKKELIFETKLNFQNYLCGYRSFLLEIVNVNKEMGNKKVKQIIHKVEQIEKIIEYTEN